MDRQLSSTPNTADSGRRGFPTNCPVVGLPSRKPPKLL